MIITYRLEGIFLLCTYALFELYPNGRNKYFLTLYRCNCRTSLVNIGIVYEITYLCLD